MHRLAKSRLGESLRTFDPYNFRARKVARVVMGLVGSERPGVKARRRSIRRSSAQHLEVAEKVSKRFRTPWTVKAVGSVTSNFRA